MAELPAETPSNNNTGASRAGTPRWVKAFAIAAMILVVTFVIFHLPGGGFGGHMPSHGGR